MPIIHQTPISMRALNHNIDDDLYFTDAFSSIIVNDPAGVSYMRIQGGLGNSCRIDIDGFDAGGISFNVPDPTKAFLVGVCEMQNRFDPPHIDMMTNAIKSLKDPTDAQDAVTKIYVDTTLGLGTQGDLTASAPIAISNATRHLIGGAAAISMVNDAAATVTEIDTGALAASDTVIPTSKAVKDYADGKFPAWAAWTPTITWTTGTPTGTPIEVFRYCQIGKTVHLYAYMLYTDSNGATNVQITPPVTTTANTGAYIPFPCRIAYYVGGVLNRKTLTFSLYLNGDGLQTIGNTAEFPTCQDNQLLQIYFSGFYEVP